MTLRKYLVALLTTGMLLAFGGTASAAFPDFSDCPRTTPGVFGCINVQGTRGNLRIKEFNVPLGESLEIRGGLGIEARGLPVFVPPTGTNGFFADPVEVPGGLLGIDWIPGNEVLAITELAGPASSIHLDSARLTIALPIKVRLVNFLLGMNCHIGSDSNPVQLNLIIGTTNPPPPNTPITGFRGTRRFVPPNEIHALDVVNVENSFSIPDATSCGFGLGLINALVDARLGLPSAAGNNEIQITNNIGLLPLV
jgi:hypothetical protein